jgi:hypothetical protein
LQYRTWEFKFPRDEWTGSPAERASLNKVLDSVISKVRSRSSSSPSSTPKFQKPEVRRPSAPPIDADPGYFKCLKVLRKDDPDVFIAIRTEESFERWKGASPDLPTVYKRIDYACRVASASTLPMPVYLEPRSISTRSGTRCPASIFVFSERIRFDVSTLEAPVIVAPEFISANDWDSTTGPARLVTVLQLAVRLAYAKPKKLGAGPITVALNADGGVTCSKWCKAIDNYMRG